MSKVAVITRTKDRNLYLSRAIESVAAQTFDDYVHVIVNDGGDKYDVDELVSRQNSAIKKRIKVYHRTTSSNAPDTIFNESIDRVRSDYVAIHDDDDTWHPEFLKRTVEVLDQGVEGVVVRANKVTEQESGGKLLVLKRNHYMPEIKAVSIYRQLVDNQLTPIAFIYRRKTYEEIGKYDSSLPVIGDWDFGIRFLMRHDIEYLDPGFALANYHHRKKSSTDSSGSSSFGVNDDKHRYYSNKLMNKYLRQELSEGRLGVGYIMSKERYQQNYISRVVNKLMPKFVANRLKRRATN